MAIGAFRLPINLGQCDYDLNTFTANGTWTKPANLAYVIAFIHSGGGGGRSGMRGAANTIRGGGGAYSGGLLVVKIPAAQLGATQAVVVGAGGLGGAAQTANSTAGNSGGTGGTSSFAGYSITGGAGSAGGGTSLVTAIATVLTPAAAIHRNVIANIQHPITLGSTAAADTYRAFAMSVSTFGRNNIQGAGSAGGQIDGTNAQLLSGTLTGYYDLNNNLIDEITGVGQGVAGGQPTSASTFGELINHWFYFFDPALAPQLIGRGGQGGGCGDLAGTVPGGRGGDGIGYGAPGGGGGASTNGANSGAGGNGTQGIVYIIDVFDM
jgi:hypothetical protein